MVDTGDSNERMASNRFRKGRHQIHDGGKRSNPEE